MPSLKYVMRIDVDLKPGLDVGVVPNGYRRLIPIAGGTFEGERLRGTVVPVGGDWNMVRSDEVMTFRADYHLLTDDGIYIGIMNEGVVRGALGDVASLTDNAGEGVDIEALYTRFASRYEAPTGKYDWLNKSIFVGVLLPPDRPLEQVPMEIYELL